MEDKSKFVEDFINSTATTSDPAVILKNSRDFYEKLMTEISEMVKNKNFEDLQETLKSITATLQEELLKVCKEKGISMDDLQNMLKNPLNYNPQNWNALQDLKEEMQSDFVKSDKQKKHKRKKNNKWAAV